MKMEKTIPIFIIYEIVLAAVIGYFHPSFPYSDWVTGFAVAVGPGFVIENAIMEM